MIEDISYVFVKWLMTTTIMVGIQNSVLVLESSNSYKVHETLKGTDPQSY